MVMQKIHFGSLEHELIDEEEEREERATGISLNELEDDQSITAPTHHELTLEQRAYMSELTEKSRGKQLAIPTADETVRRWLRTIKEPITLFGEGPYDRRERLRRLLASPETLANYRKLLEAEQARLQQQSQPSEHVADEEEFYFPGPQELVPVREWLVEHSLERAKTRLERERVYRNHTAKELQEAREKTYERVRLFKMNASQVGGDRPLSVCSFSPDSHLVATGDFGGCCRLWNGQDLSLLRDLEGIHRSRIGGIAFNPLPSTMQLATSDADGLIALWRLDQSQSTGQLTGHTQRVAQIAYHPSGRLLGSASFDYSWRLWDIERSLELLLQEGHSRPVFSIAFHTDGALVATGGFDGYGRVWDLRSGKAVMTLHGHIKPVLSLDFHPSLPKLASASEDGTARIWDLRKQCPIFSIPAHSSPVTVARWSPDGDCLLTAGFDSVAKVWTASDYRLLVPLAGHESKIFSAAFSPADQQTIVTASADRTFKLWS